MASRRVVDDAVLMHDKYGELMSSKEFIDSGLSNQITMVSDKVPKVSLKKSTITTEISIIGPVITAYEKISIDDGEQCYIETPKGKIPMSTTRMRFLKALLSCTISFSKTFTNACTTFSQQVISDAVQRKQPGGILSNTGDAVVDLIYEELSKFYVEHCS